MRNTLLVALAVALLASVASGVAAATWTKVGTGFTVNPALLQEYDAIKPAGIAIDGAGNIYVICNNGENGVYNYGPYTWDKSAGPAHPETAVAFDGTNQGGVTIFRAAGGKIDVNLSSIADPAWGQPLPAGTGLWFWGVTPDFGTLVGGIWTPTPPRAFDNKLTGAITKLVTAGDGAVYGLMNFVHLGGDDDDSPRQNQRIVRINPNGTVDSIWTPGPAWRYGNRSGTNPVFTYTKTGYICSNKIRGMALGGDGNVYWTMNGADGVWKTHYLWRYNVGAGQVEEAPINIANNGWSDPNSLFELEYVGEDGEEAGYFAVITSGQNNWTVDSMAWNKNRAVVSYNASRPWARDDVTATTYDKVWKKLWVGGRSSNYGPWDQTGHEGYWLSADLGSGNKALQTLSSWPKYNRGAYWRLNLKNSNRVSCGAKFRVDDNSADCDRGFLELVPMGNPVPQTIIHRNPTTNRFEAEVGAGVPVDIAAFDNDWHEAYIAIDADDVDVSGNKKVRVWFDGTKVFDGYRPGIDRGTVGWCCFGPTVRDSFYTGNAGVTFDWVGVNRTTAITAPGGSWTMDAGCYLGGEEIPDRYWDSATFSRWNGDLSVEGGLFGTNGDPALPEVHLQFQGTTNADLENSDAAHANGNDPSASPTPNFRCWVTTMAVNPNDGSCWMGVGGGANYTGDRGIIHIHNVGMGHYTETAPEPGAQVIGLAFDAAGSKAYALTCNMTTGACSLYKTTAPPKMAPASIAAIKAATLGAVAETDSPKIVTYVEPDNLTYFYIEDDDRASGIKVRVFSNLTPNVGERVSIKGYTQNSYYDATLPSTVLNKIDAGEAYIQATEITSEWTPDSIKPLSVPIKSVGGAPRGAQPATLAVDLSTATYMTPPTLNTTGLLVRVVGRVSDITADGFTLDDGSGFPVKVFYVGAVADGAIVGITGISSTSWDGAHGLRCILALPNPSDNLVTYQSP